MKLQQLVRELHWLEWQMRKFEDKYGLRSSDFYAVMESGQLAEFDDADHPAFQEFLEWHGLYKVWHYTTVNFVTRSETTHDSHSRSISGDRKRHI